MSGGRVASGSNVTFSAATGITLTAGFSVEAGAEFLAEIAQPAGPPTGLPRDYVGGIEYYNGVMEAIYHAEGRVSFDNGQSLYEYNLTDHLGNLRLSFADRNGDGDVDITSDPGTNEILQEHHYYPFGMAMEGDWVDNPVKVNRYLYNGKEWNEDFGLGCYDYGARWYDASIGRFTTIDRFAEKYYTMSPYGYAANNPAKYIDINGDSIAIRVDKNDVAFYHDGELYNRDGSEYRGKGVKVKKDGSVKLKGFLKSAVSALDNIRTGGESGSFLVSTLQKDEDIFVISKGKENKTKGRVVNFDPFSTQSGLDVKGGRIRPAFIGLAHELAHALDWDDGSIDAGTWLTYSDGRVSTNSEKFASHIENKIRAENNIPLREFYGIDKGKGVGRLLIPGTRMSAHYPMFLGPMVVPYIYKR